MGSGYLYSTAVWFKSSSTIHISNCSFIACGSIFGAGIWGSNSSIFVNDTSFLNNHAMIHSGAISLSDNSEITFTGKNDLINNTVTEGTGGAMATFYSTVNIKGSVLFVRNRVNTGFGGALNCNFGVLIISGGASFVSNSAIPNGGGLFLQDSSANISGNVYFSGNSAILGGGIFASMSNIYGRDINFKSNTAFQGGGIYSISKSQLYLIGAHFENNSANQGASISLSSNSTGTIADCTMVHNQADVSAAGVYLQNSRLFLSDKNYFINNRAKLFGGVMNGFISEIYLNGQNYFCNNWSGGVGGGVVSLSFSNITFYDNVTFCNNTASLRGGAIFSIASTVIFQKGAISLFEANKAVDTSATGGAIFSIDGSIRMSGLLNFVSNYAKEGGALALLGDAKLTLLSPLHANFLENKAGSNGGAIFFADPISTSYCNQTDKRFVFGHCQDPTGMTIVSCKKLTSCFLEVTFYSNISEIMLQFVENSANRAGTVLYGGQLDGCNLFLASDNQVRYNSTPLEVFKSISYIENEDNVTAVIASDPFQVCFCNNDIPNCTIERSVQTVTGRAFSLSLVTVGQGNFTVPSSVRVGLNSDFQLVPTENIQRTDKMCSNVTYSLFSSQLLVNFILYPDGPCRDTGMARREVQVTFLPCPNGFMLSGVECVCEERLQPYTTNCNVSDSSIERKENNFWMKAIYSNETYQGILIHPSRCPFDYCVNTPVEITLQTIDAQCAHNRSGILCGACIHNFSLSLGSSYCLPCSNIYLILVLPFALAGVALVALLLFLRLTVVYGTLNGLVFYANMVQINRHIFFPLGETNVLTVFIAWMNLDLGIETCFYDGMNVYTFTWLQYLFPFYVWSLVGLIILLCRYSSIISRRLGSNPVAVLSTLIFISYTKILRTIISSLSYTSLEYPDGSLQKVWLSDGGVLYFKHKNHVLLGAFAILVLCTLFLPYTFLMLFGHKLLAYSDRWFLSWINKIMPFLDAYYAPFKQEQRYWIGLLLFVRCALFLTFALNTLGSDNLNLVIITSITAGLMGIAWLRGRVYLKLYNDILEASLILNLCIFAAATYHVFETKGNQGRLAYTSVGIVFITFVGVLIFHFYLQLKTPIFQITLKLKKLCPLLGYLCWSHQKTNHIEENPNKQTPLLQPTCSEITLNEATEYTT